MSDKTRADLEAENKRLTDEVAALRDMVAAISELAARPKIAARYADRDKETQARFEALITIKVLCKESGSWEWSWALGNAAERLREEAAEPLDYESHEERLQAAAGKTCDVSLYPAAADGTEGSRCGLPRNHEGKHDGQGGEDVAPGTKVLRLSDGFRALVVFHSHRSGRMIVDYGLMGRATVEAREFKLDGADCTVGHVNLRGHYFGLTANVNNPEHIAPLSPSTS